MGRREKRTRTTLQFHDQISRAEAVSQIAHLEINHSNLPIPLEENEQDDDEEHDLTAGGGDDEEEKERRDVLEEDMMDGTWDMEEELVEAAATCSEGSNSQFGDVSLEDTSERCDEGDVPGGDAWSANERLDLIFGGLPPDLRSTSDQTEDESGEEDEGGADEAMEDNKRDEKEEDSGERDNLVELDSQEQAMLDLLKLCQDAGTSLGFFDKLVTTLRRHGRKGFNITKASKRQTFLDKLREKIACPRPVIATVRSHQVPKFNLLEQIIDLLKSILFDDVDNLCVNLTPSERFSLYKATATDSFSEVFASRWYRETHSTFVTDGDLEFLLPLIFYIDETGTDAFQRYPLEPLMFTFAIIRRHMREKSSSWRHAGFVPKVSDYDTSVEGLQMYHDFLAAILSDVKELQANPPTIELNLGGMKKRVKLILEVSFVMGDQKSQDKLCGRKNSNNGGAGRIHRGCMCSFPHGSNPSTKCQPVSKDILDRLRDIVFEGREDSDVNKAIDTKYPLNVRGNKGKRKIATKFIERRSRLARDILGRTYTMHAIENAFDSISFGANQNKIHTATLDDPLHFCNGGMFLYMGQVAYLGMQDKEREALESIVLSQVRGTRSSVRNEYPRGRYSKGFSNMTLLTADEKVGLNFTMLLALHDDKAKTILENSFQRQQTKYMTFYIPKHESGSQQSNSTGQGSTLALLEAKERLLKFPRRDHCYFARESSEDFWPRTEGSCQAVFLHLQKHGLSFILEQEFDQLQLEYLFVECWKTVKALGDDEKSYPSAVLCEVINGYPFHCAADDREPGQQENSRIEEYYQSRLYTKPDAALALANDNQESTEHSSSINHVDPQSRASMLGGDENSSSTLQDQRSMQKKEPEMRPIIFDHLRSGNFVQKHHRVKAVRKGAGNTSAILCDVGMYVDFLEISLCMQAYLHYSADLPHTIRSDLVVFERGMREFVRLFSKFFYRGDASVDTNTCKVHCFMHCISNTVEYGDPMQYESGKGERGLKDWAKSVSQTAQKTGLDVFIFQTVMRVADRLLISRALDLVQRQHQRQRQQKLQDSASHITALDEGESSGNYSSQLTKRKLPHFRYYKTENTMVAVDRRGKESQPTHATGNIPPNVIAALRKEEKNMDIINIWCEVRLFLPLSVSSDKPAGQLLRAHGALDKFGAYFDWVDANFEVENSDAADSDHTSEDEEQGNDEGNVAPAKLLAFYEDSSGSECAIVHSVEWSTGKECQLGNTRLVTNHIREFTSSGWPAIRKIKLENIRRALYAVERHKDGGPLPPRTPSRIKQKEYVVSVTISRTKWAMLFYRWAKNEVSPWSDEVETSCDGGNEESESENEERSDEEEAVSGLI
jgi:hypothetical protein